MPVAGVVVVAGVGAVGGATGATGAALTLGTAVEAGGAALTVGKEEAAGGVVVGITAGAVGCEVDPGVNPVRGMVDPDGVVVGAGWPLVAA